MVYPVSRAVYIPLYLIYPLDRFWCVHVCVWGRKKRNFTHVIFIYLFSFLFNIPPRDFWPSVVKNWQQNEIVDLSPSYCTKTIRLPRFNNIIPPTGSLSRHLSAHSYLTPALRTRQKSRRIPGWLGRFNNAKRYYYFFFSQCIYNSPRQPSWCIRTRIQIYVYVYFYFFLRQTHRVTDRAVSRAPKSRGRPRTRTDFVGFFVLYVYVCVLLLLLYIAPILWSPITLKYKRFERLSLFYPTRCA